MNKKVVTSCCQRCIQEKGEELHKSNSLERKVVTSFFNAAHNSKANKFSMVSS